MTIQAKFCSKCGGPLDKSGFVCSGCIDKQKLLTREQTLDYRKTHNKAVRIAVEGLKQRHAEEYQKLLEDAKVQVGLE